MMKIEKVKGIVFKDTPYQESSKILHVLTEEYGTIGILAKGCRSLKSNLRGVSAKLTYGYFHINYKEDGLSTLLGVDVIDDLLEIKKDLLKLGYAMYLLDLENQVRKESNYKEIFNILEDAIIKINKNFDPMIITNIVELKYLEYLGVMPVLDRCCRCGSKDNIITVNSDAGGYICKSCYNNEYIVEEKTLKLIRMFYYVDIKKIKELNILDRNKKEMNDFIENYYVTYTGLYLKSKSFLNQIR